MEISSTYLPMSNHLFLNVWRLLLSNLVFIQFFKFYMIINKGSQYSIHLLFSIETYSLRFTDHAINKTYLTSSNWMFIWFYFHRGRVNATKSNSYMRRNRKRKYTLIAENASIRFNFLVSQFFLTYFNATTKSLIFILKDANESSIYFIS